MDPRIARTRASLRTALLDLARERALDDITVGDITDRAAVNRSSFYQHYSDKETLLADALDVAIDAVPIPAVHAASTASVPPELLAHLEHVAANAELYRRILGDHSSAIVQARLRARLESIVVQAIAASGSHPFGTMPLDVAAAGISGASLGVIAAWIQRDPLPPVTTAAEWLWRVIISPGASLANDENAAAPPPA